jgi:3-dehydroquinate synthase
VAWGMMAALHISHQRNLVTEQAVRRIEGLIRYFQPPPLPSISPKRLLQAASGDKKNRAGVRRFVLLQGLGNAVVAEDVTDAEVLAAIHAIYSAGGK